MRKVTIGISAAIALLFIGTLDADAARISGSFCCGAGAQLRLFTLSAGVNVACGPPMSVCTQPGLITTQVMPRGARSIARLRITTAFELR
jgi:hypothetical protein